MCKREFKGDRIGRSKVAGHRQEKGKEINEGMNITRGDSVEWVSRG